jgi:hypothetical protein
MNRFQTSAPTFSFGRKRIRRFAFTLFGFLALIAAAKLDDRVIYAQVSAKTVKGEWVAEYNRAKPGEIYFMLQRRTANEGFNMSSDNLSLNELRGLPADALSAAKTDVNFNIVREAGTFACEGFFSNGKGTGFWTLTPSEKFVAALRARGYDNLSADELLRAAFHNLTIGFVEELRNAGYDGVPFNEILRARSHDVDAAYIREVKAMGFEKQPLEKLIRMRNHDITAEFVNEMKAAGFANLSIDQLIRLQNHEITLAFINELKAEGYENVPAETVIRLKNHDIDRDFIRRAKAQGYGNATPEELIRLSNRGMVK